MGTGDTNSPFGRSIALAPHGQVVRRAIFGRAELCREVGEERKCRRLGCCGCHALWVTYRMGVLDRAIIEERLLFKVVNVLIEMLGD